MLKIYKELNEKISLSVHAKTLLRNWNYSHSIIVTLNQVSNLIVNTYINSSYSGFQSVLATELITNLCQDTFHACFPVLFVGQFSL